MDKILYQSFKIVIQQIDDYLMYKKNLGDVVFSLEVISGKIEDKEIKKKLDQEWWRLEIIYACLLDNNSEPDDHQLKNIEEILYKFRRELIKECEKYKFEEEDPLSWPYSDDVW